MFERFTDSARKVVVSAQEEARALNHDHIGTEHLLLGLTSEDATSGRVLLALGVSADAVRDAVIDAVGKGAAGHGEAPRMPFSPQAKKVLELSLREALQLGHDYIGSGHILLGMLREEDGTGARVLGDLGVTLTAARREIRAAASDKGTGPSARARSFVGGAITEMPEQLTAIERRLTAIEDRLAAIERRLPPEHDDPDQDTA